MLKLQASVDRRMHEGVIFPSPMASGFFESLETKRTDFQHRNQCDTRKGKDVVVFLQSSVDYQGSACESRGWSRFLMIMAETTDPSLMIDGSQH